jgi:hypothetical protein
MLLNMAAEEAATAAEETLATVPGKEKEIAEDTSEEKDFNFQNIIGQKLSNAEKEELRDYAISCGYQPGALLFGRVLVSRSLRPTSAATDDSISSVVYFILISR